MNRILMNGRPRSGTTITERILNTHPDIQFLHEKHIYVDVAKVEEKERKFYDGKSLFFGDKHEVMKDISVYEKLKPFNIKYIYIYRDCRDCVASGLRLTKLRGFSQRAIWRSPDQRISSKYWVDHHMRWQEVKKIIGESNYCEIKFEDYIDNPTKNAIIMANFLGVDEEAMIDAEYARIDANKSHKGYHIQWCSNWREDFHPTAIDLLKELKYI